MKSYIYCYQTAVGFSMPVSEHALLLRCQPARAAYINTTEEHLLLPPSMKMTAGTDAFGNRIVYGIGREPHTALAYVSTGIVKMDKYADTDTHLPLAAYRQPTPLTALSDRCRPGTTGHVLTDADAICHEVHRMVAYRKGATAIGTTAAEVMEHREGVCQDFAHLMVGLCHTCGIAARYACGLIAGDGETHAWVEVNDGYGWKGFDPTHDCRIGYGYLKIAHGRDAADCTVSRGLYTGQAEEHTVVNVMLKEI